MEKETKLLANVVTSATVSGRAIIFSWHLKLDSDKYPDYHHHLHHHHHHYRHQDHHHDHDVHQDHHHHLSVSRIEQKLFTPLRLLQAQKVLVPCCRSYLVMMMMMMILAMKW